MNEIHHILGIFINQSFYIKKKENSSSWGRPYERDCYKIMEETDLLQSLVIDFDGSAVSFIFNINSNHLLLDAFPDFFRKEITKKIANKIKHLNIKAVYQVDSY